MKVMHNRVLERKDVLEENATTTTESCYDIYTKEMIKIGHNLSTT